MLLLRKLFIFQLISILVHFIMGSYSRAQDFDYAEEANNTLNAKSFSHPVREHSIIVTKEGYYPQRISIFEGEILKIYLTAATDQASCLVLTEKNLFMAANKGTISEKEVIFDKAGEYKFYCPQEKISGSIHVHKNLKGKRNIASENKSKIWRPKDFPEGW